MRSPLAAALRAVLLKDGPVATDAHVPTTEWGRRRKKKRELAKALRAATAPGTDPGLYVCRPVTPACDVRLRAWAAAQGLPPLDANLHVTLVHSARAVPWTPNEDLVSVPSHSLLRLGPLGPQGAVVLFFRSRALHARWAASRAAGAVWDYGGQFKPHLTLYYGGPVPPALPDFPLEFGPELAAPLEADAFAKGQSVLDWYEVTANAQALNCALRGEEPLTDVQQAAVARLDALLSETELREPTAVYRGVDAHTEFGQALLDAQPGQTFSAHGYTSTTTDVDVARQWGPAVLAGVLPADSPAAPVRPDLHELLLPRGTTFTVLHRQGNELAVEWHVPVAKAGPFEEDQHPRGEHGRFAVSGVPAHGPLPRGERRRVVWVDRANGEPLPPEAQAHLEDISRKGFGAPNYTNQTYFPPSPGRSSTYVGEVTDAKGRSKRFYLDDNEQANAALKAQRVRSLAEGYDQYAAKLEAATVGPHPDHDAMALRLLTKTGMRPGSDRDTGADAKAFGATNMPMSAVTVRGKTVHFAFPAKNGKTYVTSVDDAVLARFVSGRQRTGATRLFDTNETKVRDLFKRLSGNSDLKLKDLRTAHATAIAQRELLAHNFRPASEDEFRQLQKTIAVKVSVALQNTPKVALDKYILPSVWHGYRPGGHHIKVA